MPKYSVRMYSSYVDEFEVEAPSAEEAIELADEYRYVMDMAKAGELEKFAGKIEAGPQHQFVDHYDTYVNELDANGNWIE